jgi:hypothetical protein
LSRRLICLWEGECVYYRMRVGTCLARRNSGDSDYGVFVERPFVVKICARADGAAVLGSANLGICRFRHPLQSARLDEEQAGCAKYVSL